MQTNTSEDRHTQRALQHLDEQWRKRFEAIGNDITLRKWCIEQSNQHIGCKRMEPAHLLQFLTAPLVEAIRDAEKPE